MTIRSYMDGLLWGLASARAEARGSACVFRRLVLVAVLALTPVAWAFDAVALQEAEARRIALIEQMSKAAVCIGDAQGLSGGSGVLIDADGYGLTNFHVVADMLDTEGGQGAINSGERFPLEVLGIDPTGDVAMFRLKGPSPFPTALLGDSDTVRVGDTVYAIGDPFMLAEDFTPTVTAGIVSGTGRYQFGADARSLVYTDCIQIDAAINPGNSGGPLFDAAGRLIGINGRASFERRGRVNVGIAYAITINQIKRFMPGLRQGLLVEHGSLGAIFADSGDAQVLAQQVATGSCAERAGLSPGDRLVHFAGQDIRSANHYLNRVGTFPAGWPVEVVWERDGQSHRQTIHLDPLRVKLQAKLKREFRIDPEVTSSAAKALTTAPTPAEVDEPSAVQSRPDRAELAQRVNRSVVKLHGAKIGAEVGYAAGVIASEDGDIVTALSLLLEAQDLRAVTSDGQVHRCEVVYRDAYRQLAMLRMLRRSESPDPAASPGEQMAPPAWIPLPIGDGRQLQPGDRLYVVGNPFKIAEGDEPASFNRGVLSGHAPMRAERGFEPVAYQGPILLLDVISSNPGAPGSAVVDAQGRWVGMVGENLTSRLTHTDLNYALPIEEIAGFIKDAESGQAAGTPTVKRTGPPGYHGIRLSRLAYHRQLPFVRSVAADSPAARAGLQPDDLIISANNLPIPSAEPFTELCKHLRAGNILTLVIKRGSNLHTLQLTLTEQPK